MDNVRIASTPLAGLTAFGQAVDRDSARLSSGLASLAADAPEVRLLFADPEPSRDGRRVDWYGPAGHTYVALNALPADERQAVLARADQLLARVRAEGERLSSSGIAAGQTLVNATVLPMPRENYIYAARPAGEAASWRPVIVCWAHANEDAARAGIAPQVMVRPSMRPSVPPAAAEVTAAAPVAALATAPLVIDRRGGPWSLLLWLALFLLLLAIAWLMLRACGLGLPGYGVLHHIGRTFCPGVAVAAELDDVERNRALRELAGQLELQAARRRVACLTEARRAAARDADRPPSATDKPPSMTERLKREGAKSGELQISLAWDGPADLDLHVICPGGEEIYYSKKSTCGGTLDVDMNSEKKSLTPVENVFWPDGNVPHGHFKVVVVLYNRHGDSRPAIPFQVRVKEGGEEKTTPGSIDKERTRVQVMEFDR